MHRPLASIVLAAVVTLALLPAVADEQDTGKPRTLEGLRRAEVVALLGEPNKSKWTDGTETLVYKLRRVGDNHLPAADERLVDLPGIGRCVHRVPRPVEGYREEVDYEPTHVNEDGDMVGGGMSQTQSQTYKLDKGDEPHLNRRDDDEPKGKVRLLLTLDWEGTVAQWTTKGGK